MAPKGRDVKFPLCEIDVEPSNYGNGVVYVVVRYPVVPGELLQMTDREAMWIVGSIPGWVRLDGAFPELMGRPILAQGGLYENMRPKERQLIKEGRYADLMKLKPFKPTLPRHFQALGLEVPSGEEGEWIWVKKGTR